jgi:hypothetical protein
MKGWDLEGNLRVLLKTMFLQQQHHVSMCRECFTHWWYHGIEAMGDGSNVVVIRKS